MEINQTNLDALFVGFNQAFQKGFTKPPTFYEKICMIVESSSRRETYPWMGRSTKMREWLGDRVIQALERHAYTLINRDFEETIGVDRNDIEDDIWGTLSPLFENMGWNAAVHPDRLVADLLNNATGNIDAPSNANAVLAYDGVTMFSAVGHPVGPAGGAVTNYPNADTAGSGPYWFLFDVARAIRAVIFQRRKPYTFTRMNTEQDEQVFMRRQYRFGVDARVNVGVGFWQLCYTSNQDLSNSQNYANALAAMAKIKTDAGDPFGAAAMRGPGNLILMVPPALEETARRLLKAELVAGGAGGHGATSGPQSNIWMNSAELVMNPYLS
jgi:phage major head subunit gpT-like protein